MSESTLPALGILEHVSPSARDALYSFGQAVEYVKGSPILEQGEPALGLHFVMAGELAVILESPDELKPLGYVEAGETVGEMGFMEEDAIASARVTARTNAMVWSISRDGFEDFLTSNPSAGCEILKALLKLAGRRARKGNERLADE